MLDEYIARLRGVPKDKQSAEGIKIVVEQIQQCLEMKGVAGIHPMAIEWEEKAREILEAAKLLPGPKWTEAAVNFRSPAWWPGFFYGASCSKVGTSWRISENAVTGSCRLERGF